MLFFCSFLGYNKRKKERKWKMEKKKTLYQELLQSTIEEKEKLEKELTELNREYGKKIKDRERLKNKLMDARYFDIEDSLSAIAFFVSLMEGKTYHLKKKEITLYTSAFYRFVSYPYGLDYQLYYLVEEGKEEDAEQEIKARFTPKKEKGKIINDQDYYSLTANIKKPSENYIQLACCKEQNKKICFSDKCDMRVNFSYECDSVSKICDKRYQYILDYTDQLLDYKITKKDFSIHHDEMIEVARKVASEKSKVYQKVVE